MIAGINALQVRAAKSGVGQYLHALCEEFARHEGNDRFVVYATPNNYINYQPLGAVETKVWGPTTARTSSRLAYEILNLPRQIQRDKLSVFHGASNFLPLRKVCPYVVTIHDLSYYVQPERCTPMRRRYWYAMTARTVKLADRIIADSENTRRDIERFFPSTGKKIRVIYLAAHQRFRPRNAGARHVWTGKLSLLTDKPYYVYVGTLEPGKNLLRLIEAFERVARSDGDVQLVMAGDAGWLYQEILQRAASSAFAHRIHITGHIPDEMVVQLYQNALALVYPSLYEGFGMPPLEAMACGIPVITSQVASLPEVVGDVAMLIDPTNVSALADAMLEVMLGDSMRRKMAEAGIIRARKFSWAKTADETLKVYQELVR